MSVTLAASSANIRTMIEASVVVVAIASPATSGSVILTSNTGCTVSSVSDWVYRAPGIVVAVNPLFGRQGTEVLILGSNLRGSGAHIVQVGLAGVEAMIVEETDLFIRVIALPSTSYVGSIIIISDSGAQITGGSWSYLIPGVITSVSPSSGQFGTLVTIDGSSLFGGASSISTISLADIKATVIFQSDVRVIIRTSVGLGLPITGDVKIISSPGSYSVKIDEFSYIQHGEITSVIPSSGLGIVVTFLGGNLFGGGSSISSITLNSIPVTDVTVTSTGNVRVVHFKDLGL